MIYRVLKSLDAGKRGVIAAGTLVSEKDLDAPVIEVLSRKGFLSPLAAPPLSALPGWKTRATRLSKAGIKDAGEFLEAPEDELAQAFKVSSSTVKTWKDEVAGWLVTSPQQPKRC